MLVSIARGVFDRYGNCQQDSDDIAQNVVATVLRKVETIDLEANCFNYVTTIAINEIRYERRHKTQRDKIGKTFGNAFGQDFESVPDTKFELSDSPTDMTTAKLERVGRNWQVTVGHEVLTLRQYCAAVGLAYNTALTRLYKKMSFDRVLQPRLTPERWRMVDICGTVKPLAHWCAIYGVDRHSAQYRIERGWEPMLAVSQKRKTYEHNGKRQTVAAWAQETGIAEPTLRMRLLRGWSFDRAITTSVVSQQPRDNNGRYLPR